MFLRSWALPKALDGNLTKPCLWKLASKEPIPTAGQEWSATGKVRKIERSKGLSYTEENGSGPRPNNIRHWRRFSFRKYKKGPTKQRSNGAKENSTHTLRIGTGTEKNIY